MTRAEPANIPPKRNRKDPICFSPYLYRARNLVERFFNGIKQCRRVATRYDKLAANHLAFIKLASIRIWLRANESTPWSFQPREVRAAVQKAMVCVLSSSCRTVPQSRYRDGHYAARRKSSASAR
jgi:hypothetical protein